MGRLITYSCLFRIQNIQDELTLTCKCPNETMWASESEIPILCRIVNPFGELTVDAF
jgi:hypothetical protein